MTAPTFEKIQAPKQGTRVSVDANGRWHIPDDPIVCLMRGDGIGRDVGTVPGITTCAVKVTEDVYCGIEFKSGSDKAKKVVELLKELGCTVLPWAGSRSFGKGNFQALFEP